MESTVGPVAGLARAWQASARSPLVGCDSSFGRRVIEWARTVDGLDRSRSG